MIAPIIVNNQPWIKGYFETIGNIPVSENEKALDFAFWDVLKESYVDITGEVIGTVPQYRSIYGLGSYGVVGKEVQKAISEKSKQQGCWRSKITLQE